MKKERAIMAQLKSDLNLLEKNENQDDFDTVLRLFSIVNGAGDLLKEVYDEKKIHDLKNSDDASFYRFASQLKIALEAQKDYLSSIGGQLLVDEDVVSRKIADCSKQIELFLEKEQSIVNNAADILAKENELLEVNARVSSLLEKKKDLITIEKKISNIDIKKLEKELGVKEKVVSEYEEKYKPSLLKREVLQKRFDELTEALEQVDSEIKRIDNAYGKEIQSILVKIPQWIKVIKERLTLRENKEKAIIISLEEEIQALMLTEKKIQAHLEQMKEIETMAVNNSELLRMHYKTNKSLEDALLITSNDIPDELVEIATVIEEKLECYDKYLAKLAKEKQEIASSHKPQRIGD
jgi:chromosome segregation ATPase